MRLSQRVLFSFLSSLSFLNFGVFLCLLLNMKAASPFPPASLSYFPTEHPFFFLFLHCFICRSLFSPSLSLHLYPIHLFRFIPHFLFLFHSSSMTGLPILKFSVHTHVCACTWTEPLLMGGRLGMIPEPHRNSMRRSWQLQEDWPGIINSIFFHN